MDFKKHPNVLNIFKKSSIAVACSRWDELFGRTSLEASANGCAAIITDKGGLTETVTNGKILKKLSVKGLTNYIISLIKDPVTRRNLQELSIKNFLLTHKFVSRNS